MRLIETIDILAGGPGSGCVPAVAKKHGEVCGRPPIGEIRERIRRVIGRDADGLDQVLSQKYHNTEEARQALSNAPKLVKRYDADAVRSRALLANVLSSWFDDSSEIREAALHLISEGEAAFERRFMKTPSYFSQNKEYMEGVKTLVHRIVTIPTSAGFPLHRGMSIVNRNLQQHFSGRTLDLGLSSFTEDINTLKSFWDSKFYLKDVLEDILKNSTNVSNDLKRFRMGEYGGDVHLTIDGPRKAINVQGFPYAIPGEKEWITQGRFIIDKAIFSPAHAGKYQGLITTPKLHLRLKQKSVFAITRAFR